MGLTIGAHTYGHPELQGQMNDVTIGKFCSIAAGVKIDCGWSHDVKAISTYPFKANWDVGHYNNVCKGDVKIGNDVWIGQDAIIMSGVTIGDGAVIGARAFISKDVRDYGVVVGHNKFVRYRFCNLDIVILSEMKWWNWPDEKIREAAELLLGGDVLALNKFRYANNL